jgi:hypothetical protein
MIRTHFLGGKVPRLRLEGLDRRAVAAIALVDPAVLVMTVDDNGRRRIALTVEQEGVSVEIRLPDPDATLRDLAEACQWRREQS